jgi:hypothetical protein
MSMMLKKVAAFVLLAALAGCATPPPPVTKPVPETPQPPLDTNMGTATMLPDGTLVMTLRTTTDDGATGQLVQKIPPTDVDYASDLKMVGPIKPGETKPIHAMPAR